MGKDKDLPPSGTERREYFRVDETILFDYERPSRKLKALREELKELADGVSGNEALFRLLESIDSKLNAIMDALFREGSDICDLPFREVNISAGGLRFRSEERFEVGEKIKVRIGFPPYPFRVLCLLSEVVRVKEVVEDEEDYRYFEVAVKFLYLDEETRKSLFQSLMEIQRKKIGSSL